MAESGTAATGYADAHRLLDVILPVTSDLGLPVVPERAGHGLRNLGG